MDIPANASFVETLRSFTDPEPDLEGASVLVTGGTGSFGQEIVKTLLARFSLRKLIVFSRDEMKQYEMQLRFPVEQHDCMRFFIGDVRDRDRLELAMREVDYVIHAAALKHVPAAEYNPFECINTNVYGAENVVQAALRTGVKKVIALSTDKAANPVNLYGASKLASDKIFVAANNLSGTLGTRFAVVRYGNVAGSRGSIVPYFRKLIADGAAELPITDERMTRFWITLPQGVNFVLSSLSMSVGGEIFVPKIPSVRIVDLASHMAPAAGHKIIGIRPGEKIHEVMITSDDSRDTVELDDRYIIRPRPVDNMVTAAAWDDLPPVSEEFQYASNTNHEWLKNEAIDMLLGAVSDG